MEPTRWWYTLPLRLKSIFRRQRTDQELDQEVAYHLEMQIKKNLAQGMTEQPARTAALLQFGGVAQRKEDCRDARKLLLWENLVQDIRYAVRTLRKSPGFTVVAIVVLALGLGANTAIFSVISAVLLRPLPYPHQEQLVSIAERDVLGTNAFALISPLNFFDWQKQATSFEQVAAYSQWAFTLTGNNTTPENVYGTICSEGFFSVLGVNPAQGRGFSSDDNRTEAAKVVVISHGLWQRHFAGDPQVIGRNIFLDSKLFTVIGVMPPDFKYPSSRMQVWIPMRSYLPPEWLISRGNHMLFGVARLKPQVTVEQARTELDGIARRIKAANPEVLTGKGANVVLLLDRIVGNTRFSLLLLLGAVGCVLLIACVNVTNLLLARMASRQREVAVRMALGASRGRLVRQFLTESTLLSVVAGLLGMLLAYLGTEALVGKAHIPRAGDVHVDVSVLTFCFALSLFVGAVVGLMPALQSARKDVVSPMKESGQTVSAGRSHRRLRNALVSAEMALSVVLLIGGGLLLRSFARARSVDLGFQSDHLLTLRVTLPHKVYTDPAKVSSFYQQLLERLKALPGVSSAGAVSYLPLTGHHIDTGFEIEGKPPLPQGQFRDAVFHAADADYFRTMGIPIRRGRAFTEADGKPGVPSAMIISESMAKLFWPNEDALGQRIYFEDNGPRYEVVGIAGDVISFLEREPEPTMYKPLLEGSFNGASPVLRTSGNPNLLAKTVTNKVHELDPELAVTDVMTIEELLSDSTADRKFGVMLVGIFAALALILTAFGLYGVLSYSVAQRKTEIGVRVALGAQPWNIVSMVAAQGVKPALIGLAVGLMGAFASTRLLRSLLFGTSPYDPYTFAGVGCLLLVIAVLASCVPAWRASRINAFAVLKSE